MSSRHSIKISDISSRIDSCRLKEFKKNQKESKKNGSILIGPFETKEVANNSLTIYRSVKNSNTKNVFNKLVIKYDSTYYFYIIHPFKNKRNARLYVKRVPARITDVHIDEFAGVLTDILKVSGYFLIGPFETIPIAEESKRINRTLDKNRN